MNKRLPNRLKWQSRRGSLELDLALEHFWRHSGDLADDELRRLEKTLALPDEQLREILLSPAAGADGLRRLIAQTQFPTPGEKP